MGSVMKRVTVVLVLAVMTFVFADTVSAQFYPGQLSIRPEVGLGIANTFGVSFGGALTYDVSEKLAVGPYFTFSTAGRSWEGEGFKTKGSNSMAIGGRFYYMLMPDSDYSWYVNAGVGIVKFGSVSEFDDGNKIQIQIGDQVTELEVKGSTSFAFNLGAGNMFPIGDDLTLFIDANSHIGSQGDIKGKTMTSISVGCSKGESSGFFTRPSD
jgi:hypothetical protein